MSKVKLSARPFNLKLKYPFGISRGSITYAKNVLVALTYGDITAYGESAPSTYYGEEQESVIAFLYGFIKNKSIEDYLTNIQKLCDDLNSFERSTTPSPSAKAALEMACWDLIGKINSKSLYQFIFQDDPFLADNSNHSNLPPTSFTIGLDNMLTIKNKAEEAIKNGYRVLKVKLGLGYDEDVNILKTIHGVTKNHPCILRVDANGGWDFNTAAKMLEILPSYNVELLEQPLPKGKVRELAPLIKSSPIPIFVDEDCMISSHIEALAGKVNGINIKLMKTGSILEALNMINLARSYNLKVMLGCMIESSCAISAAVHLSPLADYVDLDGHLLLEYDPFSGLTLQNGKIIPSFDIGLGVTFTS